MLNDNMPEADFEKFVEGFARQLVDIVAGDLYCVLGASEWPTFGRGTSQTSSKSLRLQNELFPLLCQPYQIGS